MKTKKIALFYKATADEVFPPQPAALARKEAWIKEIQRSIPKVGEHRVIKVTYELFNPEVEQQRKFFNGPVVDYFAIQNGDILTGPVPRLTHDRARETILSDVLGYDLQLINRVERRRKSTGDFVSTQQWHDFLETLKETIFDAHGYEMPESEAFWDLAKKHGLDQAKKISLEQLQKRLAAKTASVSEKKVYILKKDRPNIGKEVGDYYNGEYGSSPEQIAELISKGVIEEEK